MNSECQGLSCPPTWENSLYLDLGFTLAREDHKRLKAGRVVPSTVREEDPRWENLVKAQEDVQEYT